ncbi:MAG: hypothetical protein M9921_11865 [Fimbriimonadaceae bacterium]|nr:hypothetical protein [Fimbriimonadaceae bacterium]
MALQHEFPDLGEFVVDGYARRPARRRGIACTVPVLRVRRGRSLFTAVIEDLAAATPLAVMFPVGATVTMRGMQIRDLILTKQASIARKPKSVAEVRTTREQALAFLNAS